MYKSWHNNCITNAMMRSITILALYAMLTAAPAQAADATFPDPTRPLAYEGGGGLVLQTTVVSAQRRFAVISGRTVRIGDKIGGATVAAIRPFEVVLTTGQRSRVLRAVPAAKPLNKNQMDLES